MKAQDELSGACSPREEIQEGPSSPSLLEPTPSRMHFVTLGLAST
jgi:hypothetical protein